MRTVVERPSEVCPVTIRVGIGGREGRDAMLDFGFVKMGRNENRRSQLEC